MINQLQANDGLAVSDPVVPPDSLPGIKDALSKANEAGIGKVGVLLVDAPDMDRGQLRDIAEDVEHGAGSQVIFIHS